MTTEADRLADALRKLWSATANSDDAEHIWSAALLLRTQAAALAVRTNVLHAVDAEFRKFGNSLPDGFDSRVIRWVADALATAPSPNKETTK